MQLNLITLNKDEIYKRILTLTVGKEGYLFPDTYLFLKQRQLPNCKRLITFESKVNDVTYKQLIMASMLEQSIEMKNQ